MGRKACARFLPNATRRCLLAEIPLPPESNSMILFTRTIKRIMATPRDGHRKLACGLRLLAAAMFSLLFSPDCLCAEPEEAAKQVLSLAGVKQGLCLHLGCGQESSAALTAQLAQQSEMLVDGLAVDAAAAQRARRIIAVKNLLGRATAEVLPLDPLPYLIDTANLIVVEDPAGLTAKGLKMEDVERVLAPGGVLCVRKDGKWTKSTKARPKEADDWTHPTHGPDGNLVSRDKLVHFPVGVRWLDGIPMNFHGWAANRAWVVANGRCFTLGTTEYENLAPAPAGKHKAQAYLTARDAFNGIPLWKINCRMDAEGAALNYHNTLPLVADGRRVYTVVGGLLVALDAATGKQLVSYPVKYTPMRLALSQGILVCSTWGAWDNKGNIWGEWNTNTAEGSVVAFDAESGKIKWSIDKPAHQVLIADGAVYTVMQTPVPKRLREIVTFDLDTGKQLWTVPHTQFVNKPEVEVAWNGYKPNMDLICAGEGIVSVANYDTHTVSIRSRDDGKVLWELKSVNKGWPENGYWTFLVDGVLWHKTKRYDPKTGEEKGSLPWGVNSGGCTPGLVAGHIYYESRGSNYFQFTLPENSKDKAVSQHTRYTAARGACVVGAIAANGMFYTAQNNCACAPGQFPGFIAFGPNDVPSAAEFDAARPLEKGPAYGKAQPPAAGGSDWPTFLHDADRSTATSAKVAAKLKVEWEVSLAKPPEGPLATAWNSRLLPCLTPPVIAGGKAFAAAIHAGQVRAVDTATGKLLWTASVGGRIDSPPTIHAGLCLVGCHDGWLYAFSAADGQLAWRMRLAPKERRMVAYGQMESVWPAIGSPLVLNDVLYASAGRSTDSDGGVAVLAIEPKTGAQIWAKTISAAGRQNDTLVAHGSKVAMHEVELDAQTGALQKPPAGAQTVPYAGKVPGLYGLVDYNQSRANLRCSGGHKIGPVMADLISRNDSTIFAYNIALRHYFALTQDAILHGAEKDLWKRKDFAWRLPVPDGCQPVAMIRCADALVLAGPKYDRKTDQASGFLWLVSCQDGTKALDLPLDVPPVCNGLAAAGQRLYVSLQDGRLLCLAPAE